MNAKLANEDKMLAKEEKEEEMRVIAVRKAHQLAQARKHADAEAHKNAELQLQNEQLTEQLLKSKLAAKRAKIDEMKEQVRDGDFRMKVRGLPKLTKNKKIKIYSHAFAPHQEGQGDDASRSTVRIQGHVWAGQSARAQQQGHARAHAAGLRL